MVQLHCLHNERVGLSGTGKLLKLSFELQREGTGPCPGQMTLSSHQTGRDGVAAITSLEGLDGGARSSAILLLNRTGRSEMEFLTILGSKVPGFYPI